MDEYAYGFTTENTHYGPTRNPHNLEHVAGITKIFGTMRAVDDVSLAGAPFRLDTHQGAQALRS